MTSQVVSAQTVLVFIFTFSSLSSRGVAQDHRPNIIIIMSDDLGYSDLGCYGSEIKTPHLDRLADNGLRFAKFYNNGRSSPTRASLLTGQYPQRVGLGEAAIPANETPYPGYLGYLNLQNNVTIAEVLNEAGYHTWISGKWHLGGERLAEDGSTAVGEKRKWPLGRGFEKFFGIIHESIGYFQPETNDFWRLGTEHYQIPEGADFYATEVLTDFAVDWIQEARTSDRRPFFLYLPFTAPHEPLEARPTDIDKYREIYQDSWTDLQRKRYERILKEQLAPPSWQIFNSTAAVQKDVEDSTRESMATYAAMIDRLDHCIGKLLHTLEEANELDNTLILYLSDNGAAASQGPMQTLSSTPFAEGKNTLREGGIVTPLIVHWPAVIQEGGHVTPYTGHVIDVLPTCLEVAEVTYPDNFKGRTIPPADGKSLVPIFHGEEYDQHPLLFWDSYGQQAVLQGNWKYFKDKQGGAYLYDLVSDGTETHNIAPNHPDKVEELRSAHQAWADNANVLPLDVVRRAQWSKDGQTKAAADATAEDLKNLDVSERGHLPSEELMELFTRQEVRYSNSQGDTVAIPYFLYGPRKLDASVKYPLILWVPGKGPVESKYLNMGFLNWVEDFLTADGAPIDEHDFFMIVPGGVTYATSYGTSSAESVSSEELEDQDKYTIAVKMLDHATDNFPVDPDRVSISGISAGGLACWELAMRYPERFAAIAPLASPGGDISRVDRLKRVAVWAFHNEFDTGVPIDGDRKTVAAINELGGNAYLTEIYGKGRALLTNSTQIQACRGA